MTKSSPPPASAACPGTDPAVGANRGPGRGGGVSTPVRSVRLSDEDWGLLVSYGERVDLTPSELIRRLVRQAFRGEIITCGNVRGRVTSGDKRRTGEP